MYNAFKDNALFQNSILDGIIYILMERRENTATISPTSSHVRFHVQHQEKENFLDDLTKGTIHLRHQHFLRIMALGFTRTFPRNQDVTVKLKSELIFMKF